MKSINIVFIVVCLGFCCVPVRAETIYVAVASSMTEVFDEIALQFTEKNPGNRILKNFGSSGTLAKQIAQGAPADLYISANPRWMEYLNENEMIVDSSGRTLAFNSLVFVGRPGVAAADLEQLGSLSRIAIGTPQSVPAGQYAKQALLGAGLFTMLEEKRKLVMAKDVRQALLYADRGEADGAFVYRTDALLAPDVTVLFAVPEELHDRISYPYGLTVSGAGKTEARLLYDFLSSRRVADILKSFGFLTAL